jgi:hypothetical protein
VNEKVVEAYCFDVQPGERLEVVNHFRRFWCFLETHPRAPDRGKLF